MEVSVAGAAIFTNTLQLLLRLCVSLRAGGVKKPDSEATYLFKIPPLAPLPSLNNTFVRLLAARLRRTCLLCPPPPSMSLVLVLHLLIPRAVTPPRLDQAAGRTMT